MSKIKKSFMAFPQITKEAKILVVTIAIAVIIAGFVFGFLLPKLLAPKPSVSPSVPAQPLDESVVPATEKIEKKVFEESLPVSTSDKVEVIEKEVQSLELPAIDQELEGLESELQNLE